MRDILNIIIDKYKHFFITIIQGKPIFKDSKSNCTLHFEWKTSLVCSRKLVEIDRDKCAATIKISSQNVIHKTVDLNDILSVKNVSLNLIYISWVQILINLKNL